MAAASIDGFQNRLLHVYLTTGESHTTPLRPDYVDAYVGGRGLAARYLLDYLPKGVGPYSPDNVAILMTGPFTATGVYACQKYEWVTKSPLTGTYLCSNCGGMLGVALREAGFDALVVSGQPSRPSVLHVDTEGARMRPAGDLWGRTVPDTQWLLRAEASSDAAVGCIGPAAEPPDPVRFASFFDGQRTAGRGGLGAVLGSKLLKAIVIEPGGRTPPVHSASQLRTLLPQLADGVRADRVAGDTMPVLGSLIAIDALGLEGLLPARNYQTSLGYDDIRGRLDSETFRAQYAQQPATPGVSAACHKCPLQSTKLCTPEDGASSGKQVRAPEFQSVWALGVNCGVLDYPPIIAAYAACNELGVDTISVGGTVGFAMECCQRGILDPAHIRRDYGGLRLEWGNGEALLDMVAIIAEKRGWLGKLLGDGVRAASAQIPGSEGLALHVKGMEMPGYDPRGYRGMGLAYATSCRGACHLKAGSIGMDDGSASNGHASTIVDAENRRALVDSALICTFANSAITEDWTIRLLRAVTGRDVTPDGLLAIGARICELERRIALRQGTSPAQDRLPDRILNVPVPGGDHAGASFDEHDLAGMLAQYYALRGWGADGVPPAPDLV